MDFALTEEQQAVFDMARAFGQEHIAPHARRWEAEGTIPRALWPELGALGLGGIWVEILNDSLLLPLPADARRIAMALRQGIRPALVSSRCSMMSRVK